MQRRFCSFLVIIPIAAYVSVEAQTSFAQGKKRQEIDNNQFIPLVFDGAVTVSSSQSLSTPSYVFSDQVQSESSSDVSAKIHQEAYDYAYRRDRGLNMDSSGAKRYADRVVQFVGNPTVIPLYQQAFTHAYRTLGLGGGSYAFADHVQAHSSPDAFVRIHQEAYDYAYRRDRGLNMDSNGAKRYADRVVQFVGNPTVIPLYQQAFTHAYQTLGLGGGSYAFADHVQSRPDQDTFVEAHRNAFDHAYHGINMSREDAKAYADHVTRLLPGTSNLIPFDDAAFNQAYRESHLGLREALDYADGVRVQEDVPGARIWRESRPQMGRGIEDAREDELQSLEVPAVFGSYRGSEAEILSLNVKKRHSQSNYIDSVIINSQVVSITSVPNAELAGYIIHDSEIAKLLGVETDTVLTQVQVDRLDGKKKSVVADAVTDSTKIEFVRSGINPEFKERPLREDQRIYLSNLRELVEQRITALNLTVSSGYYWDERNGGTINIHTKQGHWRMFLGLMKSIMESNGEAFLNDLIILATQFDLQHSNARSGFIEVFTFLFVTKQFPSVGTRQSYFHFLLRCGGVY